jgi:hypothetical protein
MELFAIGSMLRSRNAPKIMYLKLTASPCENKFVENLLRKEKTL